MAGKLIIFDCDGVLVDSEEISIRALVMCLKDCGVIRNEKQFDPRSYKGAKLAVILEAIERESQSKLPANFESTYRRKMGDLFATELKPVEGIAEALSKIPYAICVASSGPVEKIKRSLELTSLLDRFGENLFSSYAVGSWKPEPGIFLHAAKQMGASPENCIVVEDAVLGIEAAVRAGMKPLAYVPDGDESEYLKNGADVFNAMTALPDLIETVFNRNC